MSQALRELLPVGLGWRELIDRVFGPADEVALMAPETDLSAWSNLLNKVREGSIALPKTLNELNQDKIFVHRLEVKAALNLGIPMGSFKLDGDTKVFVQDYAKYREIGYGETTVLIGIAIRYSVVFRELNSSVELANLPMIAAAAQLGFVDAGAVFDVRGMSSRAISQAIPVVPSLDVEAYAAFSESLKRIKDLMWEAETIIDPVPISIGRL